MTNYSKVEITDLTSISTYLYVTASARFIKPYSPIMRIVMLAESPLQHSTVQIWWTEAEGQTFIIALGQVSWLSVGTSQLKADLAQSAVLHCELCTRIVIQYNKILSIVASQRSAKISRFLQIALKVSISDRIPSRRTIRCQFWLAWIVADSDQSVLSVSIPYQRAVFIAGDVIDVGVIILSSHSGPFWPIRHSQLWLQYQDLNFQRPAQH